MWIINIPYELHERRIRKFAINFFLFSSFALKLISAVQSIANEKNSKIKRNFFLSLSARNDFFFFFFILLQQISEINHKSCPHCFRKRNWNGKPIYWWNHINWQKFVCPYIALSSIDSDFDLFLVRIKNSTSIELEQDRKYLHWTDRF